MGKKFTWSNAQHTPIMARLDRFLISTEWSDMFPDSKQRAVPNTNSDHTPVVYSATTKFRKSTIFRCENFWLRSENFKNFVKTVWGARPTATTPQQLHDKMQHLQSQIMQWTADNIGNVKKQITACRDYMGWFDKLKNKGKPHNWRGLSEH